jgi:[CysO sulfur-carrier protein]-S-L-cysteine hydrolase
VIVVPEAGIAGIVAAAEAAYPRECCGLLAGRTTPGGILVTRVVASRNTADGDQRDRFEVDPQVRFDLMRALEGSDERLVGHYHSHPDHPAIPSATDRRMAHEPDLVWLITAVAAGRATATRAWRPVAKVSGFGDPGFGDSGFEEIALRIGEAAGT